MEDNIRKEIREWLGECLELYLNSEYTLHQFKNSNKINSTDINRMICSTQKMIVFYLKALETT